MVNDSEVTEATRLLASKECIFAGYSSGANTAAALKLLKEDLKGKISSLTFQIQVRNT